MILNFWIVINVLLAMLCCFLLGCRSYQIIMLKENKMKLWTNKTFEGSFPVPTAAVVVAETAKRATVLLNEALIAQNLVGDVEEKDVVLVRTRKEQVIFLSVGEY